MTRNMQTDDVQSRRAALYSVALILYHIENCLFSLTFANIYDMIKNIVNKSINIVYMETGENPAQGRCRV